MAMTEFEQPGVGSSLPGTEQRVPILEETLHVEKRLVESGRARVHVSVTERDEAVEALLLHQDVAIERVPIGRTVSEAPAVRQEGDVIIIPVLEEVLVVETRLVLKEELRVRIDQSRRSETQVVRLRTEHATIDRGPGEPVVAS